MISIKLQALASVSATALLIAAAASDAAAQGRYYSGDFHNHTTCSDGSTSVERLVGTSLTYLDWFIMAGHSGEGNRDCRFDSPVNFDGSSTGLATATTFWEDTIGEDAILGNQLNSAGEVTGPKSTAQNPARMWRWQAIDQFTYPDTVETGFDANKPAFVGIEWVVPGHEHASTSVISGQFPAVPAALGNARGMAQFEYCFATNSNDNSRGFPENFEGSGLPASNWTCEISEENNQALITRFENLPDQGPADYNATLPDGDNANTVDTGDHVKSTAAVYWMQENHAGKAYAVPAHLERAGPFRPGLNRGYNIEHLRNWNNAGPDVAFGLESQPGHQAGRNRGEYQESRSGGSVASVGIYTFGGTGCYAAAEAGRPGFDVDGTPLTPADFAAGGKYEEVPDSIPPQFVTVCQPGVRTAWDAMLSEGRKYWFFASSDWHNRGSFRFDDRRSTFDFLPGEYQKTYTFIQQIDAVDPAQSIVDALRSGNVYATMGDLIDDFSFLACYSGTCATMGETLTVPSGATVVLRISFRDPDDTNLSPYSFPNPALQQIGIIEPLDQPSVRHVDIITGDVGEKIDPLTNPEEYSNPLAPASTILAAQFTADGDKRWRGAGPTKRIVHVLQNVTSDKYVRVRGSNLPPATPFERDDNGNPLRDDLANNITCTDPACPDHVNGIFDYDVEGWGDLWFHGNPIFIEVEDRVARRESDR